MWLEILFRFVVSHLSCWHCHETSSPCLLQFECAGTCVWKCISRFEWSARHGSIPRTRSKKSPLGRVHTAPSSSAVPTFAQGSRKRETEMYSNAQITPGRHLNCAFKPKSSVPVGVWDTNEVTSSFPCLQHFLSRVERLWQRAGGDSSVQRTAAET